MEVVLNSEQTGQSFQIGKKNATFLALVDYGSKSSVKLAIASKLFLLAIANR
ncbi:MAG: hypothetical protein IGR93_14930 [Hydrococcus sp. C42_A2020_068]|nr:hypothetical protein [Hydrococcus sp. C42_A2020_068]